MVVSKLKMNEMSRAISQKDNIILAQEENIRLLNSYIEVFSRNFPQVDDSTTRQYNSFEFSSKSLPLILNSEQEESPQSQMARAVLTDDEQMSMMPQEKRRKVEILQMRMVSIFEELEKLKSETE